MKSPRWFRPAGPLYLPVSIPGWLLTAAALAFCVWISLAVDRRWHSAGETLIGVFPYAAPTLVGLYVIALCTSGPEA
jgi:hypothetical protein